MNKTLSNFIFIVLIGFLFIKCANRGAPQGGEKDILPPSIVKSFPENFSTNFKGNEIEITFNEYVKIKNVKKQLIISPPMEWPTDITPLGSASKTITIKINDTLQPNTTYAFNFGNSIVDNNEGNPFSYYRYVFSTGNYIDSLTVKGQIIDATKRQPETFVSVGLYEVDSTFTDSIIYKQAPKYITNTLDSVTTFSIENIKAGKYMLMALKDGNSDNKFQQKTDQIAFYKSFIDVPTDSLYTLKLFSEELDYKATRPFLVSEGKIGFGYEGDKKGMKISLLSDVSEELTTRITKDQKTDTLYYWYKPKIEADSLIFKVTHPTFEKDFTVRLRKKDKDSLTLKASPTGAIENDEPFTIFGNIPFTNFDASKMTILDKDSTNVDFTTNFYTINNTYAFNFKKIKENSYKVQILPDAFTDFFEAKNDTLNYSLRIKGENSNLGYARFTLVNATYPIILQLTDSNNKVIYEKYVTESKVLDFLSLDSGKYFIRAIFDSNRNGKYDPGNYLKKIQPERVSYFQELIIRADWGESEILNFTPQ